MFETIEVTAENRLGQLWLNRPERLNALSTQVLGELRDAARWFDAQADVRVVIVGGRGRAFSAGADLAGFPTLDHPQLHEAADVGLDLCDERAEGPAVAALRRPYER